MDADCPPTKYCDTGTGACKIPQPDAATCAAGKQCNSGFCFDGVCCKQACPGECEACNIGVNAGSCVPIVGDPAMQGHPACPGDGACAGACDGADTTACHFPGAAKACGAKASCVGDVSTAAQACDGSGTCAPAATKSCPPYGCDAASGACKQSCASTADCAQGAACDTATGKCAPTAATCADAFTAQTPDGQLLPCAPYRCKGGACQSTCAGDADCATGSSCADGACAPSADAGADGGNVEPMVHSGCASGRGAEAPGGALLLLAPLLLRRRRRRAA
jgi:hypothetical protein